MHEPPVGFPATTTPPFLTSGDKVAIVSPAGRVDPPVVSRAAEILRQQGFDAVISPHACGTHGVFSSQDQARAADMQSALDDESIKAIFCSRGGYGCLRTHFHLDWSSFLRKPKWLVGFSDVTVFHAFLSRHEIASIHGLMAGWFEQDNALTSGFLHIIDLLRGQPFADGFPSHPLNRHGTAQGILTGGNLSIIQSLRGTPLDIEPNGKILFVEDIGEHHYHIDRMMQNLKAGGILERISGLVAGYFTGMKDGLVPFGQNAYEIIREAVEPYTYPVAFGFPSGHEMPHHPLLMGAAVHLNVPVHDCARITALGSGPT